MNSIRNKLFTVLVMSFCFICCSGCAGKESGLEAAGPVVQDDEEISESDGISMDGELDDEELSEALEVELEKIPSRMMKDFQEAGWMVYISSRDLNEDYYDGEYDYVNAVTIYPEKRIIISKDTGSYDVVVHEFGHWLDWTLNFKSEEDDFLKIYEDTAETMQATYEDRYIQDERELFAEGFCQYLENPSKLQLEAPDLYEYMKKLIKYY